jgi:outer membrane protein assembly factor BamD (BamD/ComL family)
MQKYFFPLVLIIFLIAGCGNSSVVKQDIATLPANILMDKAAERYSTYDYQGALAYYEAVLKYHPDKTEEVSWARYEIGYIYYLQKKHSLARQYFEDAYNTQGAPTSVLILSEMMLKKLPQTTTTNK